MFKGLKIMFGNDYKFQKGLNPIICVAKTVKLYWCYDKDNVMAVSTTWFGKVYSLDVRMSALVATLWSLSDWPYILNIKVLMLLQAS